MNTARLCLGVDSCAKGAVGRPVCSSAAVRGLPARQTAVISKFARHRRATGTVTHAVAPSVEEASPSSGDNKLPTAAVDRILQLIEGTGDL